jgi:flavorubredoxin
MCYNSYLLHGERVAVMDSVDTRKTNEWLQNIKSSNCTPHYLVVQHMEPDHSGSIGAFLAQYPETIVVGSRAALQFIEQFGYHPAHTMMVKHGDTLDLGGLTLHFVAAPMVHWPEVMMTYVPEEKTLFSADAFGSFGIYSN